MEFARVGTTTVYVSSTVKRTVFQFGGHRDYGRNETYQDEERSAISVSYDIVKQNYLTHCI